jgi:hypothetical protein
MYILYFFIWLARNGTLILNRTKYNNNWDIFTKKALGIDKKKCGKNFWKRQCIVDYILM